MQVRWVLLLMLGALPGLLAQEGQRSSLQVTTDEDGDVAIVLDTESIRMTILPAYQAIISGFIFKPTGNDTLARQSVKQLMAGSGLLQDNFWEQDWRFSEFRHKWYDFKVMSQGPEELAVKFWTTSVGWLQADKSGVISDLISNIKIERIVRMPVGKPYFLCDVTLSIDMEKDQTGNAKMPQFWAHHSCIFTDDLSDEYQRPHVLGIAEQTPGGQTVSGDYVYAPVMAEGWSAQTSPRSKEGIIYLMDASYVQCLYNCGNSTLEWFADNMLITKDRPLHTRIYILPVIGLDRVHFADPHMILRLTPKVFTDGDTAGAMGLKFSVSPSYVVVKSVKFECWATYRLHERNPQRVAMQEPWPEVQNLRVEAPRHATGLFKRADGLPFTAETPVKFDITAHVEFLDAGGRLRTKKVDFQYFHLGNYPTGRNSHLQGGEPLAVLDRVNARPWIPTPDQELKVNRDQFNVFMVAGPHAGHYRVYQALDQVATVGGTKAHWDPEKDAGYTVGFPASQTGLTNYPYDFKRLFNYRLMVWNNCQSDVTRLVGQSILASYLRGGGGYLCLGGESAYVVSAPEGHALNVFDPVTYRGGSLFMPETPELAHLRVVVPDHPVFKGNGKQAKAIDLTKLPCTMSWHRLRLKKETGKPYLHNLNERIAVLNSSLPENLRQLITALPALPAPNARRLSRDEACRAVYQVMPELVRKQLDEACAKVFAKFPADRITDGVFARALAPQVQDRHKIDVREFFLDYGDDEKALVEEWLTANFTRGNVVIFGALSPELQGQFSQLITDAAKGAEGAPRETLFVRDGDDLYLPEAVQPQMLSLFITKHDELPASARATVLMEVEEPGGQRWPFLVETSSLHSDPQNPRQFIPDPQPGRSLAFLNAPFGNPATLPPGEVPYWQWDQWEQLVANAMMYVGREL